MSLPSIKSCGMGENRTQEGWVKDLSRLFNDLGRRDEYRYNEANRQLFEFQQYQSESYSRALIEYDIENNKAESFRSPTVFLTYCSMLKALRKKEAKPRLLALLQEAFKNEDQNIRRAAVLIITDSMEINGMDLVAWEAAKVLLRKPGAPKIDRIFGVWCATELCTNPAPHIYEWVKEEVLTFARRLLLEADAISRLAAVGLFNKNIQFSGLSGREIVQIRDYSQKYKGMTLYQQFRHF